MKGKQWSETWPERHRHGGTGRMSRWSTRSSAAGGPGSHDGVHVNQKSYSTGRYKLSHGLYNLNKQKTCRVVQ